MWANRLDKVKIFGMFGASPTPARHGARAASSPGATSEDGFHSVRKVKSLLLYCHATGLFN